MKSRRPYNKEVPLLTMLIISKDSANYIPEVLTKTVYFFEYHDTKVINK